VGRGVRQTGQQRFKRTRRGWEAGCGREREMWGGEEEEEEKDEVFTTPGNACAWSTRENAGGGSRSRDAVSEPREGWKGGGRGGRVVRVGGAARGAEMPQRGLLRVCEDVCAGGRGSGEEFEG
jgi:hypothetical protein